MQVDFLTKETLEEMKHFILDEIKQLLSKKNAENEWLKSKDVQKMLGCSAGTLINLRTKGCLPYSKIEGTLYFRRRDINNLFEQNIQA